MTEPQLKAARPVLNAFKQFVKLDVIPSGNGEAFTAYLIADPSVRAEPFVVTNATPTTEITQALKAACQSVVGT